MRLSIIAMYISIDSQCAFVYHLNTYDKEERRR